MANKLKIFTSIVSTCCVMPIWFYLVHWLLQQANATELVWFLFWVCVPLAFFVAILRAVLVGGEN